jgi:hypothetical protein
MFTSTIIVASLAFANTIFAVPLNEINERSTTFTVTQVPNPHYNQTYASGPLAVAHTYLKYGIPLPENLKNGLSISMLASKKGMLRILSQRK